MVRGAVQQVFWNDTENRLRAFWRLLIQGFLFLLFNVVLSIIALLLFQAGALALGILSPGLLLFSTVGMLAGTLFSVWIAGRFLDRRRLADFGLHTNRTWWIDLGFGLGLGALLMTLIFLVELAVGWVRVTDTLQTAFPGWVFGPAILFQLVMFICVGFYEELLARGYWLRNMAEGFVFMGRSGAVMLAWLISSGIFGLLHATNPNATLGSTINIMLAGLFLGLGYVLTRSLAIPIGLHITWNFFQGNVFGFAVSGLMSRTSFIVVEQTGPVAWTGGVFGPEAGLLGIAAMLLGSILILLWVRQRYGHLRLDTGLTVPPLPYAAEPAPVTVEHEREVGVAEQKITRW